MNPKRSLLQVTFLAVVALLILGLTLSSSPGGRQDMESHLEQERQLQELLVEHDHSHGHDHDHDQGGDHHHGSHNHAGQALLDRDEQVKVSLEQLAQKRIEAEKQRILREQGLLQNGPAPTGVEQRQGQGQEQEQGKTRTDLLENDPKMLLLPFSFDLHSGITFESEFTAKGVFKGKELAVELVSLLGQIPFHANFRPAGNVVVLNDHPGDNWGKEIPVSPHPLKEDQAFTLSLSLTGSGYSLKVDGVEVAFLHFRFLINPSEVVRFSIWCRSGYDCLELSEVRVTNIPVAQKKPPQKPAPTKGISQEKMTLFIGVMSSPDYKLKRDAVRKAWFQDQNILDGKVQAAFFVGRSHNPVVNEKLQEEVQQYGDIVVVDLEEDYYSIANKTLQIMTFAATQIKTDFVMKCDDDTYVRVDRVLGLLEHQPPNNLYMGFISDASTPIRDPKSKWYMPYEKYQQPFYPPFAHGPGYIVSQDLAVFVDKEYKEGHLPVMSLEDVGMGIWVDHAVQLHGYQVKIVHNSLFLLSGCRQDGIIGHYISPMSMICMWKKYTEGQTNYCC